MKVYSFDVFDTVLTRIVAHPADVFRLMEKSIRATGQLHFRGAQCFSSARIWAEFRARRKSKREDVTLDNIYEMLKLLLLLDDEQVCCLMELELEIERRLISPIAVTFDMIRELRCQGNRLVFISDMYLPTAFVRELLISAGIAEPNDPVYVSGDLGVTKGSGKLFDLVLAREGILAGQLIHYGDNLHSDVAVPRKRGIAAGTRGALLRRPHWLALMEYGVSVLSSRINMGLSHVT